MRDSSIGPLRSASAADKRLTALTVLTVLFSLAILPAQAATRFWDGGNADLVSNGDGNSDGSSGTWTTPNIKNWDPGNGLPHVAWVNGSDVADINGGTQTLTLGANIILGGIVQKAGASGATISPGSGAYTLTLNITGANTFLAAASATTGRILAVNAAIAGGVGKNLVLAGPATSGSGTINLGGANTFSGTTNFSAGATGGAIVYLNNRLAFQNSTVTLSSDANLIFNDFVTTNTFTFGGLAASSAGTGSNLALRNDASIAIALTVGGNNTNTTYNGVLSGGGSLIKTGSGTLTLGGANIHGGTTTVSTGTLQVDGSTTSPTNISNGATLSGSGLVNATVTVSPGGSITPGMGNLTVSNLAFTGTATLNIGALSGNASTTAMTVTNAVTVSGGAESVTVNLPTALGFNGTYALVQFGSGLANATGFKLGTVPTLAWNQTGTLQVSGNFLNYVIAAAGDTTPPTLSATFPANNATNVLADADLVATFDETLVAGSGSIELRRSDASLVESFNVTSSSRLAFSTAQLTINPTNVLPAGTYYVLIPAGAIKDSSGNSYAGISSNTGWRFTVPAPTVLYTDTGSPTNPPWSEILPTLNVDSSDPGPVHGSLINVNNAAVEVGLYGNRPISVPNQRIHVACNTSTTTFANFTRWFQTDGNTQVLRIFVDDENTATNRTGTSSHTEAFMGGGWNYTDNKTYEWTGHYTMARILQGFCSFQLKNSDNDWAFQLTMGNNNTLVVNNRTGTDTPVTNPDGSLKVFEDGGFDLRVLDDGLNYRLWIDGVLYASGSYSRPTGTTTFRWGMYFGANNLNPPADVNILLVSGAQVKSWPGKLTDANTTITKANNTTSLDNGASWVGGVDPGLHNQALWNSTVLAANTAALAGDQQWAGLKIVDPGGDVTINGSGLLGLDEAGLDMTAAMRNLTVNCPVQMTVPTTWGVGPGRTAIFNGILSGYPGLTLNGGGALQLNAANTYSGDTTVSAGTLVVSNNSAAGSGRLVFNGGHMGTNGSCALNNEVDLSSSATFTVNPSQTLTLKGVIDGISSLTKNGTGTLNLSAANKFTGTTVVNFGTLAIGNTSALLSTSSLTLGSGTLLQPNLDGVIIKAPITAAGTGTISAPTNTPGSGVVSTLTLRSVLAGSGNVTFSSSVNQDALSTVYLGAQSSYSGTTLLDTAGTSATQIILKLGIHNALPTSTVLRIDGQTGAGLGRYAELNLNGFSQQLAGLTNTTRSFRVQRVVNSDISTAATLTINNSSSQTFSGTLGGSASGSVSAPAMPGTTNGNNFGLTKSGLGTFTLSGANTYSGSTTISQGTLSLEVANAGNDTSTVTIAPTGATLNLAFTGTDTVDSLFIGGTRQAAGIYEAVGNPGSGIEISQLSGTGTLTVTSGPPAAYTNWQSANSTPQALDLDHDGDGVANGIEHFLGGNTNTTGFTALPGVTKTGGTLSVTWIKAASYTGIYGTGFVVETSFTLSGVWTTETVGGNVTITGNDVKYTFPAGTGNFARLRVMGP